MATLSGAGVPAVVLKGLALEALLYERHEARPRSDTDVLVPDGLLRRAEAVLAGLGFVLTTTEPHVAPDPRHARTWRRAADGALVDLHWRVYGSHAPAQQVWDVLSAHHAPLAVGGATLTVLDPPASAMLCATHAAQHAVGRRGPREDLAAGGAAPGPRRRGARPRRSPARSAPHEAFGDGLRVYSETAALADALAVPRSITRHRRHRTAGTRWDVTRPGVGPRRARLRRPGAAGGAAHVPDAADHASVSSAGAARARRPRRRLRAAPAAHRPPAARCRVGLLGRRAAVAMSDVAIALLCPTLPTDRGNGLAMRAGLFLEGLASVGPVELVVVPIYAAPMGGDAFAARHAHTRWTATLAGEQDRAPITAMLATAPGRDRAGALHPLPGVCRYPDAASRARLDELLAQVGLVHVMRSFLTPWVDGLLDRTTRPPVTLDFDELDSDVCAQLGDAENARRFARLERSCARRVDQSYTASAADARTIVVAPGCRAGRRRAQRRAPAGGGLRRRRTGPGRATTCCSSATSPTRRTSTPSTGCAGRCGRGCPAPASPLVGSAPGDAVRTLGELDGVTVAADVPEVGSWYAAARVAVVPLRARRRHADEDRRGAGARPAGRVDDARGVRACPVGEARGVLVADDADAFAAACRALLVRSWPGGARGRRRAGRMSPGRTTCASSSPRARARSSSVTAAARSRAARQPARPGCAGPRGGERARSPAARPACAPSGCGRDQTRPRGRRAAPASPGS